jgi:hypothetical protein
MGSSAESPPPRWGGFGWGWRPSKSIGDDSRNAVRILENVVIPESENPIALGLDQTCPGKVARSAMLSAVRLDHKLRTMAGKVRIKAPDRHLVPEMPIRKILA